MYSGLARPQGRPKYKNKLSKIHPKATKLKAVARTLIDEK